MRPTLAALLLLLLPTLSSAQGAAERQASERPNILFILTDNQPAEALGAYGNREFETPHLDRLAREGMLFTRAFSTNGLCTPSRASILTGLMPSQHGMHAALRNVLPGYPRDWVAVREFRTLPATLAHRGYRTAMIGKWHLGRYRRPALGYQHWVTFSEGHTTDFYNASIIENGEEYEIHDRHLVEFFTDKAIEYLVTHEGDAPFFLKLNYDAPYFLPPTNMGPDPKNPFYSKYEGRRFTPFPGLRPELLEPFPLLGDRGRPRDEAWRAYLNGVTLRYGRMHNDPATMLNMAAQNEMVDHHVGRLMAALKEAGMEEDTLVVFSSDQGNLYGQHGLWGHPISTTPTFMVDTTFRIPLIFRHWGAIEPYRRIDMVVSHYDLMSTLLDYAGFGDVEITGSPGRSFAGVLTGDRIADWPDEAYFEHEESRSIRTPLYFYTKRLPAFGENELYDLVSDPKQQENVAGNPKYAETVAHLDRKVTAFFERYSDPRYDLWKGGRPKGIIYRPWLWRELHGDDWNPIVESAAPFEESAR
ncbi:MAG: sulfatase-like hydrolase/transferase [Acidobacteria bacterium]|nr:sulfatase-like hydrolase/transferase [Acidobacteriota bacterium]